ncbi:MAG TPA: hypothetical protein VM578_10255 [Candidatus Saccharimonadales bacterium]|nr:hypothetical protein [Candidatus Saccharimonadales bacterium]
MSTTTYPASYRFNAPASAASLSTRWLAIGAAAAIASIAGAFLSGQQFYRGYLIGYMLVLGFSLGSLALLMLGHLTGGNWWMIGRRVMEAAVANIPLLTILFVPIWLGRHSLYIWLDPAYVASHHEVAAKSAYLNDHFWTLRAVLYFAIWNLWAWGLRKGSLKQDGDESPQVWQKLKVWAAPGLLVYGLTITLACTDWVMSLDPAWYSTIFGMFFMISEMLSVMALMIVILCSMREFEPYNAILGPDKLHDYGKLMLAFTMVWAYFSFSQWLIIWAGNLPEEITWYLDRIHGGWQIVALALVFLQFALPFTLLLSRELKRDARKLVPVALLVLIMRYVDLYWLVAPNPFPGTTGDAHHLMYHWTYLAVPLALVSIWLGMFFREFSKRPLLVVTEPMLPRLWEQSHGH